LPLEAFKYYMLQDYHFLTHFSRSNALAAYKTTHPSQIAASARIILHVDKEMNLHRTLCAEYGVPTEEMDGGEEDLACVAYTRWVLDVGSREDWFALQVAMMPCLLGYGVIAERLYADPHTKRGSPVPRDVADFRGERIFTVDRELRRRGFSTGRSCRKDVVGGECR
jgi:thiaminase